MRSRSSETLVELIKDLMNYQQNQTIVTECLIPCYCYLTIKFQHGKFE
ncbi:hypothetical protein [Nodularia sphaerocarpa]|nr:hypothetical protein [Nodularia sphaerocarpa]